MGIAWKRQGERAEVPGDTLRLLRFFTMIQGAAKLATYEDLLQLGEKERGEIIEGVLVIPPPPLPAHGRAQMKAGEIIGGPFDPSRRGGDRPGGWWIISEVEVRLSPQRIVRPDIAGWRRERLVDPSNVRTVDVVPDWICEILSPSSAAHDRVTKRRVYAAHQVPYYWLLDTEARTLEALRFDPATGYWSELGSYDEDSVARIAPFEAIEIEVGAFFLPKPE